MDFIKPRFYSHLITAIKSQGRWLKICIGALFIVFGSICSAIYWLVYPGKDNFNQFFFPFVTVVVLVLLCYRQLPAPIREARKKMKQDRNLSNRTDSGNRCKFLPLDPTRVCLNDSSDSQESCLINENEPLVQQPRPKWLRLPVVQQPRPLPQQQPQELPMVVYPPAPPPVQRRPVVISVAQPHLTIQNNNTIITSEAAMNRHDDFVVDMD